LLIVLFDADVIIDLHSFGIWDIILEKNKILIPSIMLRREVFYFIDSTGIKHLKKNTWTKEAYYGFKDLD